MATITTEKYKTAAVEGIGDPILQKALFNLQERFGKGTAEAYRRLPELFAVDWLPAEEGETAAVH